MLITKEEIQSLPILAYTDEIELIATPKAWEQAYEEIKDSKVIGFDTETKPTYVKGPLNTPAVMQIASDKKIYVIQLLKTKIQDSMLEILTSPTILKVGVAIQDDMTFLQKHEKFTPAGLVDLAKLAHLKGYEESGLRTLCARLLGGRLSKTMQCSNWERSLLSSAQLQYAATDAWASLKLYHALTDLPDNPLPVKEKVEKVVKAKPKAVKNTMILSKEPISQEENKLKKLTNTGKAKAKPKARQKKQK